MCMNEYNEEYDMCPYCGYDSNTPAKEMYFLQPGTYVQGRYEIGAAIGSGGFGITYRAWDITLQKIVAVKEYYPAGLVNRIPGEKKVIIYSGNREKECQNGKIRYLEEARNMAKFNTHANIVNVYDFFEENNTAYIIMEFLDGKTYKEYIRENGEKVEPEKAVEVTNAILNALDEVHSSGILHRDISPDNIFLCKDGKIKLIDFGAARFSSTEEERTRSIILKPGFAPPEQYQTKSKQGPWTDIYAVGATMYQAITGVKPPESVNRVEEDTLVAPNKLCEGVSQNLNNTILRAMALLPELRFQTTKEFMEALNSQKNVRDVQKELKRRKGRRLLSVTMVVCIVAVAFSLCLDVLQKKKHQAGILEDATITMWVCAEDESQIDSVVGIYKDALEEYRQDYPQIEINIQGFAKEEYLQQVEAAAQVGSLPTILDTTSIGDQYNTMLADLDSVLSFVDKNNFYFLSDYTKYFPSKKKMPLAFRVPVIFYNTVLEEGKGSLEQQLKDGDCKVTARNYLTYYNIYEGASVVHDIDQVLELGSPSRAQELCSGAQEQFMDNQLACLISDTGIYGEVEKIMAGYFSVGTIKEDGIVASFTNCFSISNQASDVEKDAATQILVYLLSETGQDVLNVQNANEIPLNKNMYATYINVNPQLKELSECFDKLIFIGEKQEVLDEWYECLIQK